MEISEDLVCKGIEILTEEAKSLHSGVRKEPLTYGEFSRMILPYIVHWRGRKINNLLDTISERQFRENGILLSSLVVNGTTGIPGSLYFDLAIRLGCYTSDKDKKEFWEVEFQRIKYHPWQGAAVIFI